MELARYRLNEQLWVVLALCVLAAAPTSQNLTRQDALYQGDRVLRIQTPSHLHWYKLTEILESTLPLQQIDVWREPDPGQMSADVYVACDQLGAIQGALRETGLRWSMMIDDVGRLVRQQQRTGRVRRRAQRQRDKLNIVGRFVRHHTIESWLIAIATKYPNITRLYNIGQSFEGRAMYVLKLGLADDDENSLWIDAGLHAREWVAPASAIYIIDRLLRDYQTDEEVQRYLNKLSWYFLPMANPDGYEHTFTKYRFWRKNRRPMGYNCTGVDLNRNWGFMWGGADASPHPCSEVYRGPEPSSEPEVKNIIRFLYPRRRRFVLYMSLHSYGQKLLGRWAFTNETLPDGYELQETLSQKVARAMSRQHRRLYETGTAASLLYLYSGGSADWAHGKAGIRHSYVTELRDDGFYGFLLPSEEIIPTGEEIWAGMMVFVRNILKGQSSTEAVRLSTVSLGLSSTLPSPYRSILPQGDELPVTTENSKKSLYNTDIYSSSSVRQGMKLPRSSGSDRIYCSVLKLLVLVLALRLDSWGAYVYQ